MQHGHRSVASRASSGVCLSVALLVAWCGRGYANTQPDQLLTGRKLLIKIDTGDPSRNKLVFVSKDTSFDLPDASNNPTAPTGGGRLRVLDLAGSAGMFTITLDHTRWEATKNGFKYKGQTGDACKRVLIKDDHLVKIVCKGSAVALTLPFSGAAALELTIGTSSIRYCASFGGSVKKNTGGAKGIFKSKDALAPGACPCGNGLPNLGEQCDDGNNFNGDCCSSTCQFEAPGSPCEDGNPCTQSETCNGTGVCNGGAPVCGNGVTDLACGEQCDVPDDSACPGLCLANCHCLAPPECAADTSRTVFAGGPNTIGCEQYNGNQSACATAFQLLGNGVVSCFYDLFADECHACDPESQAEQSCINACDPPTCPGDPTRTVFAGGPQTSACHLFDGDHSGCLTAFHIGASGTASCYYDSGSDECLGCGPEHQNAGDCLNTCAVCKADPSRTIFLGGPNNSACHQFDGDPVNCLKSFHTGMCGNDDTFSCFYDSSADECRGCGPSNEENGDCTNTCKDGPLDCSKDPSRTIFAGGPNTQACHQFDGDPIACNKAFHLGQFNQPHSCFYESNSGDCLGCGPSNQADGSCIDTCTFGALACTHDPDRTFAGSVNFDGCHAFDGDPGGCQGAFDLGECGLASCFYDSQSASCAECDVDTQSNGECANTCAKGVPSCAADSSRTILAGGGLSGTQACHEFDGDQDNCEAAFHVGMCGVASCYYDSGSCSGCGPNNENSGNCTNTCNPPKCAGNPARTIFAGGPNTSACHQFDGDSVSCDKAFHLGSEGVASCFYDQGSDECSGCGPNNEQDGDCTNDCHACPADPSRTTFAGWSNTQACHQFDGDKASCLKAYHFGTCGSSVPFSCYYDDNSESCQGCGPNNQADGNCINTCVLGPVTCTKDPARTVFAGGPNTSACHQFDGDPVACNKAFHIGACGPDAPASCYYDAGAGQCNGCGPNNEQNGYCANTCLKGPIICEHDPSRTLFAGMPFSQGCHQFDGDQAACESAFHLGASGVASCFYDGGNCNGCGVPNESDDQCINTCKHGPPSCPGDPSRGFFAGGPHTGACGAFSDMVSCLSAFHLGQCGIASCYWDGNFCAGCGPNNQFNVSCFNTCDDGQ